MPPGAEAPPTREPLWKLQGSRLPNGSPPPAPPRCRELLTLLHLPAGGAAATAQNRAGASQADKRPAPPQPPGEAAPAPAPRRRAPCKCESSPARAFTAPVAGTAVRHPASRTAGGCAVAACSEIVSRTQRAVTRDGHQRGTESDRRGQRAAAGPRGWDRWCFLPWLFHLLQGLTVLWLTPAARAGA